MIALIDKEWRRLLRQPGTPWMLFGYILLPLVIGALGVRSASSAPVMPGQMNQNLMPLVGAQALSTVATWQIVLIAALAPWLSAGLLTFEIEERTLDAMLAAGQRLFSVVVAKVGAIVLFVWLLILAGLPAFLLPMIIGGTNWRLMGKVLLLELAVGMVMAVVGLLLSAGGRRTGSVAVTGLVLGLAITFGSSMAANSANPAGAMSNDQRMMFDKMRGGGMQPMVATSKEIPKWLYFNPLVGLNTALNQPSLGRTDPFALLAGGPGINSKPIYKEYRLWQAQVAGAGALAIIGVVISYLVMLVRLRWRWPIWRRLKKGVALHG